MDFLKKLEGAASGQSQPQSTNAPQQSNNGADQEDYLDKGLDAVEKKLGHTQSRETNEKITDAARGLFEKATGKKVDPKVGFFLFLPFLLFALSALHCQGKNSCNNESCLVLVETEAN